MREVATNANLLAVAVESAARGIGLIVVEAQPNVRVVDDGLFTRASLWHRAEQVPSGLQVLVEVAIAQAEQERQHLVPKVLNRDLWGVEGMIVGPLMVLYLEVG
ncbi:hypothetical protein [Methylobacterium sp. E-025]|uniref:hypothetical protein n=1 Tax=Methylobacterium sp. E-025 TaxID=2836561 RepID=UPI0039195653